MTIRRLDETTTRKIAAGEVIERPASVLKELLENSLDAKSESISVAIEEGGIRSIVVRDDGEGMTADDLHLCVERHTTSKIVQETDLDTVSTLGFRGEALASIASVARMRIISCVRGEKEAHQVRVVAGDVEGPLPAARAPGTTVEVEDLFFNLPARANFLGAARTEFFHANRVFHRLALVFSDVSWSLKHDGRAILTAPHASSLLDRIAQVYGAQVARAMIPVEAERDGIAISGFISQPDLKRGNRRDQLFCVNGRPVNDRGLSYVLASSYRGMLRRGTYPLAMIRVDLPLDRVDVNVHPRKEEIRFAKPRAVQEVLGQALQSALSSRYIVAPFLAPRPSELHERIPSSKTKELPFDLRRGLTVRQTLRQEGKVRVSGERRVIGQLQKTYLLVETAGGLEIVDQHIAHERILYEELCEQFHKGEVTRQQFLLPVRLELSFENAAGLASSQEELEQVGIVLDEFGGGTFLLREYPSLLAEGQARYGFQELAERLAELLAQGEKVREALFEDLLAELACAGAIKAGDRLPLEEQQSLVERLMQLKNPYTCPHGRPIIFTISREELDRRFRRA